MMLFNYMFTEEVAKYLTDSPVFSLALKEAIEDHKAKVSDILGMIYSIGCMDDYFPVETKHKLSIVDSKEHMFIYISTYYNKCMLEMRIDCTEEDR